MVHDALMHENAATRGALFHPSPPSQPIEYILFPAIDVTWYYIYPTLLSRGAENEDTGEENKGDSLFPARCVLFHLRWIMMCFMVMNLLVFSLCLFLSLSASLSFYVIIDIVKYNKNKKPVFHDYPWNAVKIIIMNLLSIVKQSRRMIQSIYSLSLLPFFVHFCCFSCWFPDFLL